MIQRLREIHARMRAYVGGFAPQGDPRARTSEFWKEIFDQRPDLPDVNGMLTFRRSPHVYGIGGQPSVELEAEERLHRNSARLVAASVPAEFVRSLAEPAFGAPLVFEQCGTLCSENFLMNARKAWVYKNAADAYLPGRAGLHVCDIGGGWGAVGCQLHQCLDLASFTDIDLPGNLFFGGVFLQMVLPDRPAHLVRSEAPLDALENRRLYFALPDRMDALRCSYDLILNSLSLQEMDQDSAASYVRWARAHLREGGLFVSINRHGLAGVRTAWDFGFQDFAIREIYPISSYNFFMGAAYVTVMQGAAPPAAYDRDAMNALADLMQLGLDQDLEAWCAAFCAGTLAPEDLGYLRAVLGFLSAEDPGEKAGLLAGLDGAERFRPVTRYLQGLFALAVHDHEGALDRLRAACDAGLGGCARAKARTLCCAVLGFLGRGDSAEHAAFLADADRVAPFWAEQVREDLRGHIGAYKADIARKLSMRLPDLPAGKG